MRLKTKQSRSDIIVKVSDLISQDNEIRFIDLFVDKLDILSLGITYKTAKKNGKDLGGPSEYDPKDFLRLYLYGYLNRVRSSRLLAKQCEFNAEVIWLLSGQTPKHNVINQFRKDNSGALLQVFWIFNEFWRSLGLFGEEDLKNLILVGETPPINFMEELTQHQTYLTFAVDGSKFRAQNSKANNYNSKKIEEGLVRWNDRATEYLQHLANVDGEHSPLNQQKTDETATSNTKEFKKKENTLEGDQEKQQQLNKLEKAKNQIEFYQQLQQKLKDSDDKQISTIDSDARRLWDNNGSIVGYNVLIASEASNKMIACFEVSNTSDANALYGMAKPTKDFLNKDNKKTHINVLADKAFCTAEQIMLATKDNIITYISHKVDVNTKKDVRFRKDKFRYNKEMDLYICPENSLLKTNGKLYKKDDNRRVKNYIANFQTCKDCPFVKECLAKTNLEKKQGRVISRSEFEEYKEYNKTRVENKKDMYQKRKEIVEHPFGTIKRNWGYSYTLLKGFEKIKGEFALIFAAYNLRRAISELGINALMKELNKLESIVFYPILQNLILWALNKNNRMKKKFVTVEVVRHHRNQNSL